MAVAGQANFFTTRSSDFFTLLCQDLAELERWLLFQASMCHLKSYLLISSIKRRPLSPIFIQVPMTSMCHLKYLGSENSVSLRRAPQLHNTYPIPKGVCLSIRLNSLFLNSSNLKKTWKIMTPQQHLLVYATVWIYNKPHMVYKQYLVYII